MTTDTLAKKITDYIPARVSPMRHDAPGVVKTMPTPAKIHHVHIYSDLNYDAMVEFYQRLFNASVVNVTHFGPSKVTFLSYDDHDHRVIIIGKPGWGTKPEKPVGVSHLAFGYASLGELMFLYKRMREYGYAKPPYCVNHGNSTSMYWNDPDGNQVETMADNYTPQQCQDYKRHYQFSAEFGEMDEGCFDPDKMLALFEQGVPDTILMDREQVKRLRREGKL
jgi:catechol 2,3-dioxygenase-like lactoylglutathione lyase family enzyme